MSTVKSRYTMLEKPHKTISYEALGSKIPPHSTDAEMAVLGSMMLDRSAVSKAIEVLDRDSFYHSKHKILFELMTDMFEKQIDIDLITLGDELQNKDMLELIGGTYYLTELNTKVSTSANIEHHSRIVKEKSLKRLLIETAGEILSTAYDESSDALEEIDRAESIIFEIAEKRFIRSYQSLSDLAHDTLDIIAKLAERDKSGLTGVASGFNKLDEMLSGFQKSDLIIIAGRPSMGKTALALSMVRNAAVEYKKPIAFFSIEMSSVQLVMRLISGESKINQQKIRSGMISQSEYSTIVNSLGRLADSPIIIDDSPDLTMMELRAKCRRLKAEHKIEMVVIDYLQLLHPPKAESREREISIMSRSLKQMAKELDLPVVALAQLNRTVEARSDKRPMLSDLRESGSIEQDADVVIFVNRPEVYGIKTYGEDNQPTEGTAEVIIGKQRNGPVGTVRLAFIKDYARFENLALNYHEPPAFLKEDTDFEAMDNEEDSF